MQGVVDQAHWVVLAVVLASVLHTPRGWRAVLQANLAAGAAMACIVIARALDIGVPYFGALPESSPTRFGGPFGNSSYLSIYMLVNLVLAAGFAARAWATVAPPGDPGERRAGVFLWATVAALHLAGVVLSGSVGGFAGLMTATGCAALGFAWLCRGPGRLAAVALLVVLATVCTVLGTRFVRAVSGFVMVLGYSRALFALFTLAQTLESFLRGHVAAFQALGGSARALVYDNLRSVVPAGLERSLGGHPAPSTGF